MRYLKYIVQYIKDKGDSAWVTGMIIAMALSMILAVLVMWRLP